MGLLVYKVSGGRNQPSVFSRDEHFSVYKDGEEKQEERTGAGKAHIFLKENARRGENKRKRKKMGAGWARNICSLKLEISG